MLRTVPRERHPRSRRRRVAPATRTAAVRFQPPPPVLAVAVYDMKNAATKQEVKVVRFLLPLGLMLAPGMRFDVDGQREDA